MALASNAEDMEVLLISVTYGNVDLQKSGMPLLLLASRRYIDISLAVFGMSCPCLVSLRKKCNGVKIKAYQKALKPCGNANLSLLLVPKNRLVVKR